MAINFNTDPYYDDFSESKEFYRILFKPGRAVQARELTQLQTTLQNQIARFGQNVFKEGAIVIPGQQIFDNFYNYVKLTDSFNGVNSDDIIIDLIGGTVTGQTTGVTASIVNYAVAESGDPSTIYVKYTGSGTDKTTSVFADGELLSFAYGVNSTATLQAAATSATGKGVAYSIAAGVIFCKNHFVYFGDETLIVSKYSDTPSKSVGFLVTESIITSDEDEDLLDPAAGSNNYFAPGADRYSINLTLQSRTLPEADTVDNNYVEISKIQNGVTVYQKSASDYNVLGDILARRTFDESGNYTVRPYGIENIEHLRTTSASIRDGLYTANAGGNADLVASVISPGKAYVLGYEIDNIKNMYVITPKARDFVVVNNSTVSTLIGNYITITGLYSVPDLITLSQVDLYNSYTATPGSAAGTKVGTARISSIVYVSGSGMTAIYTAYLFDIKMSTGYAFDKDVRQIYYDNAGFVDSTANVVPTLVTITGTVTTTNASNVITGVGTKFNTDLRSGDFITINGNISAISSVVSDISAFATANLIGNVSGISASKHTSVITNNPSENDATYLFEFPYSIIKTVDPTNLETSYQTKRIYDRTLSGGNVSITAGTDEVFAPFSVTNYMVVNKTDGAYLPLTGNVTRSGSPTGKTVTFTLGSGYASNDVRIISTIAKTNSAADKKTKTLVSGATIDFTSNITATATVLSLAQADIYTLSNVRMSANAFGTAYSASNSVDITSRYTLDNGQKTSHYDLGSVRLLPGQPTPTGPVRVTFSHFTHSSGDFFSVDSYNDIDYKDIPTFTAGSKTYNLRDCLDFRPKIDANGTTFTSPSEFLDQDVDILTDYSYYLPRTDKIVLNSSGTMQLVKGVSSLTPQEPATPQNTMAMFVLAQKPYVFDVIKDIDVTVIDNRRYTMRDIGKLENRIKTLEYYTTLSLLETDTSLYQIKDGLGFDRFKNGFVVDNFTGHKVGNPLDSDYKISMDFQQGILRPSYNQTNFRLKEISTTAAQRTSNNYAITGNIATLPYTSSVFVESNAASRVENINPFSVVSYIGSIILDPPSDVFFDTEKLPDIQIDREGNYSTLVTSAQSTGKYGTVWGSWQTNFYGGAYVDERQGTTFEVKETIDTVTNNDVLVSQTVIPKMRNVSIKFTGTGMKPNTRVQAYFENYRVTDFVTGTYASGNTAFQANTLLGGYIVNKGNIFTDAAGVVSGTFNYDASHFNFPTGDKLFRLTDSPTNSNDSETAAEAKFSTSGQLKTLQNQIISTRNGYTTSESIFDRRASSYVQPPPTTTTVTTGADTATVEPVVTVVVTTDPVVQVSPTVTVSVTTDVTTTDSSNTVTVGSNLITTVIRTTKTATHTTTTTNGVPNTVTTVSESSTTLSVTSTPVEAVRPPLTYADVIYGAAFGRLPDQGGADFWAASGEFTTISNSVSTMSPAGKALLANLIDSDGAGLDGINAINQFASVSAAMTDADRTAYHLAMHAINTITHSGAANSEYINPIGSMAGYVAEGFDPLTSATITANQIAIALLAGDAMPGIAGVDSNAYWPVVSNYFDTPGGASIRSIVQEVNINPNRATSIIAAASPAGSSTARTCWSADPLAQTFIISGNPTILTGVDIFFYSKDTSTPMYVELRTVVNGSPSQTVVPFSRRVVTPDEIVISEDGSVATYLAFDGLVYLEPGEYALVLLTSSINYRVWISQIGETDVGTGRVINDQPFVGVLFKSQNASSWEANQNQDLKFRMYNASFTSTLPATIDFEVNYDNYQYTSLGIDPLEFYPNSSVLKVYHTDNGFVNGSTVKLFNIFGDEPNATLSGKGNIYGVNVATINNVQYSVSNVKPNSYTIILPASSNTTSIVRAGGNGIVAERDFQFDAVYPAISSLDFAGTISDVSIKVVDKGYTPQTAFIPLTGSSATELSTTAVMPSETNITNNLSGARPMTLRITLNNKNPNLSPIVDMEQLSAVFIKNIINNPSYSSENLSTDIVTVARNSNISFTNASANTGFISIVSTADKANVSGIVKGTTVTVSNTTTNSGTFRVLNVLDAGANILVAGTITTAAAANVITVTNGRAFIAEEAATGGSALAKYITRQVDLVNPSSSINIRLDISKPENSDIKIYYKTKLVGEAADLSTKEYVELTGLVIPTSLSGEFFEVEKQIDDTAQFTSIVFKIVLLSDDTADIPKCKNLRAIMLV
jgi:hypothetical protein